MRLISTSKLFKGAIAKEILAKTLIWDNTKINKYRNLKAVEVWIELEVMIDT